MASKMYYSTYSTTIMKDLLLDGALQKLSEYRPLPRVYRSNWRMLHIDGFETKPVQFFQFTPMHYDFKLGVVPPSQIRMTTIPAPPTPNGTFLRIRDDSPESCDVHFPNPNSICKDCYEANKDRWLGRVCLECGKPSTYGVPNGTKSDLTGRYGVDSYCDYHGPQAYIKLEDTVDLTELSEGML